jgi:acyl-CoA thioester hydrolase
MKEVPFEPRSREVSHTFRVRYAETDAMGIVHHASYLIWMEMGRTEFMRHFGFTYRELEKIGVLLPVVEVNVRYKQSSRYDDEIRVSTWVEEMDRVRLKLAYRMERVEDRALLIEASSTHTYIGTDGKLLRITHHAEAWEKLQAMLLPNENTNT